MPSTRLYGPTASPAVPGLVPMNTSAAGALGPLPANQVVGNAANTVIVNPVVPTLPLQLQIPSLSPLEGQHFEIYASGMVNTGVSATVAISLYSGTSLTPGQNTLLASSGVLTAFAGAQNWYMQASAIFDSVSGLLSGTAKFFVAGQFVAEVAFTAGLTGVNNRNSPVANFLLSVQFGTANAANRITVQEFAVNF